MYDDKNKKNIGTNDKKMWNASRFCVSSLRRGHANLLCIVPILVYVLPKQVHWRLCQMFLIYSAVLSERHIREQLSLVLNITIGTRTPTDGASYVRHAMRITIFRFFVRDHNFAVMSVTSGCWSLELLFLQYFHIFFLSNHIIFLHLNRCEILYYYG